MNIETKYTTFISATQKDWKDKITNQIEIIL